MKTPKREKKAKTPEALPLKQVLDELTFVRKCFHDVAANYATRLEGEMAAISEIVAALATRKKVSASCARDVSDLLLLLRGLNVKAAKGRRRDLKTIESLVADLRQVVDAWE